MCLAPTITVRFLYFIWFGASSCLLPYLSLHMRALNIPVWETAVISGVLPLFQLFTCSVAGTISRSSRSHKESTMWSLLFTAISALTLLLAPAIPTPTKKNISIHFQCGPGTKPGILVNKCNHVCEDPTLLPSLETYFRECHVDCPNKKGIFKNSADVCFDDQHNRVCHVVGVNNTLSENFTFGISLGKMETVDNKTCLYGINGVTWHQVYFQRISCPIILKERTSECLLKCELLEVSNESEVAKLSGTKYCLEEGPNAVSLAIWVYFGLRALFQLSHGISSMMIDNGLSNYLRGHGESHRRYSIWSYISASILTPVAGFSVDFRSAEILDASSYNWLFLAFSGLVVITISLVGALEFESYTMPPLKDTLRYIFRMVKIPAVCTLLFLVLIIGVIAGFFDTFLFWYLEDLTTPHWVMGFTISSGIIVGGPLLIRRASFTLGKLGKNNLLILSLTLQFFRCIGYYCTNDFWWSILLEFLGAVVFHILWKAVSMGRKTLLPNENALAFQACAGVLYYGLGKCCGSLVGGALLNKYNFKLVFLSFGSFCGLLAAIYFIAFVFKQGITQNLARKRRRTLSIIAESEDLSPAVLVKASSALLPQYSVKEVADTEKATELSKLNG